MLPGGRVRVFSRNAEDMTAKYPDIVARVPSWLAPGTESVVIDGEAVAWDAQAGRILPFQVCVAVVLFCCVVVWFVWFVRGRALPSIIIING